MTTKSVIFTTCVAMFGTLAYAQTAFWQFEEGTSATTTFDTITNTESATFPTGSSIIAGGAQGTSFAYDNTGVNGSFIDTNVNGTTAGITGAGNKTIVTWFKADTGTFNSGRYGIFSYSPTGGSGAGADLRLLMDSDVSDLKLIAEPRLIMFLT